MYLILTPERKSDMPAFIAGLVLGAVLGFILTTLFFDVKAKTTFPVQGPSEPVQGSPPSGTPVVPPVEKTVPAPEKKRGPVTEATVPAQPPTK